MTLANSHNALLEESPKSIWEKVENERNRITNHETDRHELLNYHEVTVEGRLSLFILGLEKLSQAYDISFFDLIYLNKQLKENTDLNEEQILALIEEDLKLESSNLINQARSQK